MISVAIPPAILAHLLRGGTAVLHSQAFEETVEIYILEHPDLSGTVGEAIMDVLPFLGEKQ